MSSVEQARVALEVVKDAGSGRSLLELGWLQDPRLQGERALVRLALPGFAQSQQAQIAQEIRQALLDLDGVDDVQIEVGQPAGAAPIGAAGHGAGGPDAPAPPGRADRS